MATLILIPGAWHGAWCWDPVTPLLQAAGHRVLTPELTGTGADRARAAEGTLAGWADQVAALVAGEPGPVILAGHSRGGAVISEVAQRLPDRIARLVYVAALLLPDRVSVRDVLSAASGTAPARIHKDPDGTCRIDPDDAGAALYNTTPPDRAAAAIARLGPEPRVVLRTPVRVTPERFGRVPRGYVECRDDRMVPLATQRALQAAWPCERVVTLDGDHSPFCSAPDALAQALNAMATL